MATNELLKDIFDVHGIPPVADYYTLRLYDFEDARLLAVEQTLSWEASPIWIASCCSCNYRLRALTMHYRCPHVDYSQEYRTKHASSLTIGTIDTKQLNNLTSLLGFETSKLLAIKQEDVVAATMIIESLGQYGLILRSYN